MFRAGQKKEEKKENCSLFKFHNYLSKLEELSMASIGVPGLIIILVLALIIFGPSKLPQLGRAVGDTLREFKSSTKEVMDDVTEDLKMDDATELDKAESKNAS